ncbi:CHAT domain-containing protein [Lentzea albidocapillata]|uniref:CHAT domain-containing protein n=1 Tax=Lentzea albidocapillata TaxID=40571 RepID=UPI00115F846E|nr:CHAT domain-containing protein [Lentzea albidocapillata]
MDIDALRAHAADLHAKARESPTAEVAQAAVEAARAVVLHSPSDDVRAEDLWFLGWALVTWWNAGGEDGLFDEAITMFRVVAGLPGSRRNAVLAMVSAWGMRAQRDPSRAMLDAAITEVSAYAGEFPEAAEEEANLLVRRYTVANSPSDLNEAIVKLTAQAGLPSADSRRTRWLLGSLLRFRYESFQGVDDLVRAIGLAVAVMLEADERDDEEGRLEAGGLFADCLQSLPDTPAAAADAVAVLCDALHEKGDRRFHQELVAMIVTSRYKATGKPSLLRVLFGLCTEAGYEDERGLFAREIVLEWAGHRQERYAPLDLLDHEIIILLGLCAHAIRTHTAFGDLVNFLTVQLMLIANVWSSSGAELSPATLKSAIEIIEPVVDVVPEGGRKALLSTLSALHLKYLNRAAEPGDGRAFIEVNRRLAADRSPGALAGLANALLSNYRRIGAGADLDEAVRILAETGSADYTTALVHANALLMRFDRDQATGDWLSALGLLDQPGEQLPDLPKIRAGFADVVARLDTAANAVSTPLPPEAVQRLYALCTRAMLVVDDEQTFQWLQHRAHTWQEKLTEAGPADDDHAKWTLARSLIGTHADDTPTDDLDRATRLLEELLSKRTGKHFRALALSDLSGACLERFAKTGDRADLDRSITTMCEAVQLRPGDALMLANLSHKLSERFEIMGSKADLDESLALGEHARDLIGDDTDEWMRFIVHNGLAGVYRKRFAFTADPADLDRALTALRAALDALPADHPDRAMAQHNLAGFLLYRTTQVEGADPEEIVRLFSAAVDATPAGHPARHSRRVSLAQALLHRSETSSARPDDQAEALRIMRDQLAGYGPDEPRRFEAAYVLASALTLHADSATEAMEVFQDIVRAPRAAAETRLRAGVGWAMLAERADSPEGALAAWDEVTRLLGVVAWQGLPRGDQERFLATYQHHVARAATFAINAGDPRRALDLLEHGRSILWQQEGSAELELGAGESAVVLVAHGELGHAVLVGHDDVRAIELPGMTAPEIDRWCGVLDAATSALGSGDRETYEQAQQAAAAVLDWLWHVVVEPVLAALPETEGRRRLFWCPTGPLAMMPLHAATDHGTGRSCLDLAVSSYVPSLRSLATTLARRGAGQEIEEFLTIAIDDHPDEKLALVHVKAEVATVERLLPSARHTALLNLQATRAAAAAELARHRFVHVSCHGAHDPNAPSGSGIVLADGVLSVLDIAQVRTDDAQFAYLSACRTAMGAPELSDESIHLGAALFLAGFRQVVGTLWAVGDQLAAKIAEAFYRKVVVSGPDAAATAIGEVALLVRAQRKAEPLLWAGYVHIGA